MVGEYQGSTKGFLPRAPSCTHFLGLALRKLHVVYLGLIADVKPCTRRVVAWHVAWCVELAWELDLGWMRGGVRSIV